MDIKQNFTLPVSFSAEDVGGSGDTEIRRSENGFHKIFS